MKAKSHPLYNTDFLWTNNMEYRQDQMGDSHNMNKAEAIKCFEQDGWKYNGFQWMCPACVSEVKP